MSVLLQTATRPGSGPMDNSTLLVIRLLGARLRGTPQDSCWQLQPYLRDDRQVHQVDRGQANSHHADKAAEFIEEISHRFGVPNRITTDLGTSFSGSKFWDYCQKSCIDVYYASVAHPRCNGHVERANGLILQGLKARIFDSIEKYGYKNYPR